MALAAAGVTHFTNSRPFVQHLPPWLPGRLEIVYGSGVVEIALAVALVGLPRHRRLVGRIAVAFFVVVFPANVYVAVTGTEVDGLPTGAVRWIRLPFQVVLIAWALWSTRSDDPAAADEGE